jgi:hypothetical protein
LPDGEAPAPRRRTQASASPWAAAELKAIRPHVCTPGLADPDNPDATFAAPQWAGKYRFFCSSMLSKKTIPVKETSPRTTRGFVCVLRVRRQALHYFIDSWLRAVYSDFMYFII